MTITILSPYQVFFIDESEKLGTVLKDGRVRYIKSIPSFACFSSKNAFICGVEFQGESTLVQQIPFNFSETDGTQIFALDGYSYYPVFDEAKHPSLSLLSVDLLNPAGTADLVLYQKARTKYHPFLKLSASITPPMWDTDRIYYITAGGALARTNGSTGEKLTDSASLFCMTSDRKKIAYYDNDCLFIVDLDSGHTQKVRAFDVTACCFAQNDEDLYFASSKEGVHNIYLYNTQTQEITLVCRTVSRIKSMTVQN